MSTITATVTVSLYTRQTACHRDNFYCERMMRTGDREHMIVSRVVLNQISPCKILNADLSVFYVNTIS